MSDVPEPAAPLLRIPAWFIVSLILMTALLIVLGILRSNRSTLRGDEIVTLLWNREDPRIADMLMRGARLQVSPAPLFYIVDRLVDEAKARVGYLGLGYSGYFRLPSLLFSAALGAWAAGLIALRLRRQDGPVSPVAWFLVLCGVAVYWCQPKVFSFACVDRPYGLWNGLWLLSLAWLLARPDSRLGLGILLSLLALTATASCFQILAIGLALVVVRRLERTSERDILREGALLLTIPALISVYYALRSEPMVNEALPIPTEAPHQLLRFWLVTNFDTWIVVGCSCALLYYRPALRRFATPVAAFAILLLIVPVIYTLARMKGYSSPSRHYIWTTTALPLGLFLAALSWPELRQWRPAPKVASIAAASLVIGFSIVTFFRPPARNDSRRLACLDQGSPLESQLRHERPTSLIYPNTTGDIEAKNIALLAEWIRIRYHESPSGLRDAPIRDVRGELISEPIVPTGEFPGGERWGAARINY